MQAILGRNMSGRSPIKIIILYFLLSIFSQAFAKETLWLSNINAGDCVADRIQARKTSYNLIADKQYCINNNAGDPEKIKICQANSAYSGDIVFFTDRCSNDYYLGLNGTEYTLKRHPNKNKYYTSLIGSFYGKGLKVEVKSIRLTSKEYQEGTKNVQSGSYDVQVTIQKDKVVQKFSGSLGFGP
jgi:hypothetical protein